MSFSYFVRTKLYKMKPLYFILAIALVTSCKKELINTHPSFTYTYTDSLNNSLTISAVSMEISAAGFFSPAVWQQRFIFDNDTTTHTSDFPTPQLRYDSSQKTYNFSFLDYNLNGPAIALSLPALDNTNTIVDTTGNYRVYLILFYAPDLNLHRSVVNTNVVRAGSVYNGTFSIAWDNGDKLAGSFQNLIAYN